MQGSGAYIRLSWSDRFQKPTTKQLREPLQGGVKRVFDSVRKHLSELDGVREETIWYGDCWRWCLEYRTRLSPDPLALLIPCPQDLQLALPMDREFTSSLPIKRMKRAVRDGLELAQEPFDTRWGVWSLGSNGLLDDLQDLIELKLTHLAKRAG
ncbi:MAG: hypothetical protein L0Y44_07700 [Phycisphaerales bacterium]|nr:hypothetical protein [Phycisphaerales bacterium]